MDKVIFLDFDGVLNTRRYINSLKAEGKKCSDEFGFLFDPVAVENLRTIVDAVPDARIVIISTWNIEGLTRMKELWYRRNLPGKIYDITLCYVPDFRELDLDNPDSIDLLAGKGKDIQQWIKINACEGCTYVIVDDDDRLLPEQLPRLVRPDSNVGLSADDAARAVQLLAT